MNKYLVILDENDQYQWGAVGKFDKFEDKSAFANAICDEILEKRGYVSPDDIEVKYMRMRPYPPGSKLDFIYEEGKEGKQGSFKAYVFISE